MRNIICMKWGTLYGPEYVNRLYSMTRRHLGGDFRFICLTEDSSGIVAGVEVRPLPTMDIGDVKFTSGWRKLSVFSAELSDVEGPTLFLDLDVVLVGDIDAFFDFAPGAFCIIENWTQMGQNVGNSSVFRFEAGRYGHILTRYEGENDAIVKQWDNEQMYLTNEASPVTFWPAEWCRSFKHHCLPRGVRANFDEPAIPAGARIIVFHGQPNPPEAAAGQWRRGNKKSLRSLRRIVRAARDRLFPIRRVRPARWIQQHWN